MASFGVLANAQINVIANLAGFRGAMRETQAQLWGLMTIANRMGGSLFQNLISPFQAYRGMARVKAAQAAGQPRDVIQSAALAEGRTLLLAGAIFGLGRALVTAAQYASDFKEELNKATQTFGESTGLVASWVNRMGEKGVDRAALLGGAATMGVELLGSGIGEKMAASMAMAMSERAVDVSSLYNIDQDSAIKKFISGLAGFGRPLKELGVIVTENRVETYAFTHGLWDAKSAITEATKVQARYGLIMQETARAQGDFIRTHYELANQYRQISGNFTNMMQELGNFAPLQGFTFALNQMMIGLKHFFAFLNNEYQIFSKSVGAPGGMEDKLERWEASNRNQETESRVYADEVIAQNFMGKGHHAAHTGLADFGKRLQEGVFNDTGKQQIDLTRRLVGLTEEQAKYMRQLGFKNIVDPDFVPF